MVDDFKQRNCVPSHFLNMLVFLGFGRGKIRSRITFLYRYFCGDRIDCEVRGIKYRLNLSDNVVDRKILCSSIEPNFKEIAALKQACRGRVFVDVGANIGYFSLIMATSGASKVLSVEPNPCTLERLRAHVKINKLEDIIIVVPQGAGEEGFARLFFSGNLGSASLIESAAEGERAITIQTRPLIDILTQHHVDRVGGMKIDVEGMEDRILMPFFKSAPKTLYPLCLVIEHCHRKEWKFDIFSFLQEVGYRKIKQTRGNTILNLEN